MTDQDGYEYVERRLNDAGEEWRARLGPPPAVNAAWFANDELPTRRWWPAAAAAAAIAVLAGVLALAPALVPPPSQPSGASPITGGSPIAEASSTLPSSSVRTPSPSPEPTARPTDPPPAVVYEVVHAGDLVSVTGQIIDWSAGPRICNAMVWDLSDPPQPGCFDSRDLPITDIDPRDLPGAYWPSAKEDFNEVWVTDYFRVFGTWRDGTIEYVDAIPAERPPFPISPLPPVPCEAPIGGWPGEPDDVSPADTEGHLVRRLQSEVDRHPDLYGGLWPATDRIGDEDFLSAMVVATVGDVRAVEANLREIYPANLCVVRAEYNTLELEAEVERLSAQDREWTVFVDPQINRVAVWLSTIDDQTSADLLNQARGKVQVLPVAARVDADPPANGQRICGRVEQAQCSAVIALVREARPDLFTSESVEIVDYGSPPGVGNLLWSYQVAVVSAGCPGSPIAFSVDAFFHFERVKERERLIAHVAELLPAGCAVAPT